MFNIGICDDEKSTCSELENFIYKYGNKNNLKINVDVWYTGESLCDSLKKGYALDILFLDIRLNSTNGVKVGTYIRTELDNIETSIVYISSISNYAMSLFKIQPLDFLIKPLTQEAIDDVLSRGLRLYERLNHHFEYNARGFYYKIPYKDIIFFYSQNKKINIVLRNKELQFNGKLKDIIKTVPHNFIVIHQSYIINLDYVSECSYEIVKMQNGTLLNISQPYRKTVREQIMQCKWEQFNYDV